MGYIKFIDGLPRILKILIVIFVDVLVLVYRIIKDVMAGHIVAIILDIFLGGVAWVMDIIDIIFKNRFFSWGDWIHF
jgi:hypothetical protein